MKLVTNLEQFLTTVKPHQAVKFVSASAGAGAPQRLEVAGQYIGHVAGENLEVDLTWGISMFKIHNISTTLIQAGIPYEVVKA